MNHQAFAWLGWEDRRWPVTLQKDRYSTTTKRLPDEMIEEKMKRFVPLNAEEITLNFLDQEFSLWRAVVWKSTFLSTGFLSVGVPVSMPTNSSVT